MRTQLDTIFDPAEIRAAESGILKRQAEVYVKILELGLNPDSLILKSSAYRVLREWFESPELQSAILRTIVSFAVDMNEPGHGGTALGMMLTLPMIGFNRGGTPELANHRTPIENLYATGGSWHVGSNCGSSESYNGYKIIANDLARAKPWEEAGKEEPDWLVEQLRNARKRVRDSVGK